MIYNIPEQNMDALVKKLSRIRNKCNKYGCDFHMSIKKTHYEKQFDEHNLYVGSIKMFDIEVSGTAVINNWAFVATLEHTESGNIVRIYGDQEVPAWAYTTEPKCDHCHTKHRRKDTYIIRNELTGEFKQVGRSCLKDFTKGLSAEAVAAYMSSFDEAEKAQSFGLFESCKRYYRIDEYLLHVVETVKHFGYTSKANADESHRATSTMAHMFMVNRDKLTLEEMKKVSFNADTEENKKVVKSALEWISSQEDDFGYIHNLKVACDREYGEARDFGIIASLIPAHFKAVEKETNRLACEAAKANKPQSNWVGEVGQRIEITAECKCVASWYNDFGAGYLYKFTTAEGNIFTWKTGKAIENGQVTLKGTIKAHTEFRDEKQTELTRCKIA